MKGPRVITGIFVDNAIKFTEKGEVELSIRHFSDQDQDYIRFSVRDTGTGIAKDYQELIFEYFSQVDISSTRKFGGLGLGLTLAQRLLRLMGSELCFESDENEGSLFWSASLSTYPLTKTQGSK